MKKNMLPLIGIVAGFALIIWAIATSGPIGMFWDVPSLIITLAGSFCALLISFPMKTLKNVPNLLKKMFVAPQNDRAQIIEQISQIAKKIRMQGVLSIEEDLNELDNEMLVYGLQMVVDGVDEASIEEILETEM